MNNEVSVPREFDESDLLYVAGSLDDAVKNILSRAWPYLRDTEGANIVCPTHLIDTDPVDYPEVARHLRVELPYPYELVEYMGEYWLKPFDMMRP